MAKRLFFNGREYSSPDGMPPDVRRLYEQTMAQLADKDGNQIADILERVPESGNVLGVVHSSIQVNGREYESVEAMPAEVRVLYEAAMTQAGGMPATLSATFRLGSVDRGTAPAPRIAVEMGVGAVQLALLIGAVLLAALFFLF